MNNCSLYNNHLELFLFHLEKLRFLTTYHELENEDINIEIPDIPYEEVDVPEENFNDIDDI